MSKTSFLCMIYFHRLITRWISCYAVLTLFRIWKLPRAHSECREATVSFQDARICVVFPRRRFPDIPRRFASKSNTRYTGHCVIQCTLYILYRCFRYMPSSVFFAALQNNNQYRIRLKWQPLNNKTKEATRRRRFVVNCLNCRRQSTKFGVIIRHGGKCYTRRVQLACVW